MRTLPDLLFESERRYGQRAALAMRHGLRTQVWSYQDLGRSARSAAAYLQQNGLTPGDRVLMLAPNSPELVASMFGVWLAGGILVPLDLRTPADIVKKIREQTEPKLLLASMRAQGTEDPPVVSVPEVARRDGRWPQTTRCPEVPQQSKEIVEPGTLAEIVFTSGTTGSPKGVMLTHGNILANVESALEAIPFAVGQRLLSLLPLSHMLEQTSGLYAPLRAGATIYYTPSLRSTAILGALQRHDVQLLICVPEVLRLLLGGFEREIERLGKRDRWQMLLKVADHLPMAARPWLFRTLHERLGGQLREVVCGGAALDPELWQTWERLGVRVLQGYGATECAPVVTSSRRDRRMANSVGWPLPGVEVRIAADSEVLVRGRNVTPGYWQDPAATAAAFEDGWYRTGDLGVVGPSGEIRLLGRKKEMIVLADGRNVFPDDVEAVLRRDAAIKECVVIGRPRAGGGEEVHAVLVPEESADDAAAAVRRANGQLGPHQQVNGFTIWTEPDFPRTPSLKIRRGEVRTAIVERPTGDESTQSGPKAEGTTVELELLLARLTGRSVDAVRSDADLALDLGLDSLGRVELAVVLEEAMGRSISDEEMATLRTVSDLRAALERGGVANSAAPLPKWPRSPSSQVIRALLQNLLLFPLFRRLCQPLRIEGATRLSAHSGPALIIANHTSHFDSVAVLSILPALRRRRTAVAAAADYFFTSEPLATFAALALGAFPFHRDGPVSTSLADCGDLVDRGYSILIFPEGTRSPDGGLQPFKPGIGLLARELKLPVVPIHLDGLHNVLPKGRIWPRPGEVTIRVGEALEIDPAATNLEASASLEAAMKRLAFGGRQSVVGL